MEDFNLADINDNFFTCESIGNTHFSFRFLEFLCDCFINQLLDSPTRLSESIGRGPNIMDLVLTNIDDHVNNVNVGPVIGRNDHHTITFNIDLHPIAEEGEFKRYLCDKGNYKEMNKCLKQAINIYTSDDTDCIWHAIKTNIRKGMKLFHTDN